MTVFNISGLTYIWCFKKLCTILKQNFYSPYCLISMGRFFENFYSVSLQEYFVGFLLRFLFCFSDVVLFLSIFLLNLSLQYLLCVGTQQQWTKQRPWPCRAYCLSSLLAKVVDLDPCLSKKPLEEKTSHPHSARESLSEVQSLSSFQSESCDDNGE